MKTSTRWSEKKGAKLSELSLNFPKLADWLCMGWSVCQAAAKAENSYAYVLKLLQIWT